MTSLKKNFSMAKLYSDLEKYQANLVGFKDSRLKRQSSGTSIHQRPNSTHNKNHESREAFGYTNLSRFQKPKLQVGLQRKVPRQTYENVYREQKSSFLLDGNQYEGRFSSQNSSVLQENYLQNYEKKSKSKSPHMNFNKSDQLYFLNQCNKLYKLNGKDSKQMDKKLTPQQQADSVKTLLNQINKRDRVYDTVSKRLGTENVEDKLSQFFNNYEKMKQIIGEFKKMSKLNIDNDQQLYEFLTNEDDQNNQYESQTRETSKKQMNND